MLQVFLPLLSVPNVSEWKAQGLLLVLFSLVRQFCTVFFLFFTETTSTFWLNQGHSWKNERDQCLLLWLLWLFPMQALTSEQFYTHQTGTTASGYTFSSTIKSLKYIFQLLGTAILYVMYLYMYIYTIILHRKKTSVQFTLGMPSNKVKMSVMMDDGDIKKTFN